MGERSVQIVVVSVVALLALGIVMLLSTSVFTADHADIYHDVRRQMFWLALGVVGCAVFAAIDYRFWHRSRWVWFGVACCLLVLCFVPAFGERLNGSARWVSLRDFGLEFVRLQPSELAKLAVLFVIAAWMADAGEEGRLGEVRQGFLYPFGIALVPIGLIAIETDMGTAALLACMVIVLLYIAGCRWWLAGGMAGVAVAVLSVAVLLNENRRERFFAYLDIEENRTEFGLQQFRGLLALGEGGLWGLGLGEGREKLMYLPYAHTDFIFPMIGEEIGAIASLSVVFAFVLILVFGVSIASSAPDRFGKLLGFGVVILITLQAALNIGVTTGVLPNKGLPLPFVSYGGSNLLFSLAGVGILLNIYRQGSAPQDDGTGALFRRCRAIPRV